MIKNLTVLLTLACGLAFFYSCEKEDALTPNDKALIQNSNNTGSGSLGTNGRNISAILKADIDTNKFTAKTVDGLSFQGITFVDGVRNDSTISLSIQSSAVGVYSTVNSFFNDISFIDPFGNEYSTLFDTSGYAGSIEITSYNVLNDFVSGTFSANLISFSDTNIIKIRNGVFADVRLVTPDLGAMTATVDGVLFTAATCLYGESQFGIDEYQLVLADGLDTNKALTLRFSDSIKVGSFPLDGTAVEGQYFDETNGSRTYLSQSGVVDVTRVDRAAGTYEGTFSFIGKDTTFLESVTITDGTFRAVDF